MNRNPALLAALLDVTGLTLRYAMGTVTPRQRHELFMCVVALDAEQRTPEDVKLFGLKWPIYLHRDAAEVSRPTPGQILEHWERVTKYTPSPGGENAKHSTGAAGDRVTRSGRKWAAWLNRRTGGGSIGGLI